MTLCDRRDVGAAPIMRASPIMPASRCTLMAALVAWCVAVSLATPAAAAASAAATPPAAADLGTRHASAASSANLTDLFTELDARLPTGYYRGPSLVTTPNGTLLAFVLGALHRHDGSPTIVYVRRSLDSGSTWSAAAPVLLDPSNRTHFTGAAVVDAATHTVHYLFQEDIAGEKNCTTGCVQRIVSSRDDGLSWSQPALAKLAPGQPANATWGKALGSGIALRRGPHAGRLLVAVRHDCGCPDLKASLVVYSDTNGATWQGGAGMMLLPQFGGGWTECEVAELHNGSVLLTSRNMFGRSSGQGPRLFARSDTGGATWAANWSATDLPDPYCEASIVASEDRSSLYFGNPSNAAHRGNFSVHRSTNGGVTWPASEILYPGPAAYSDMSLTRDAKLGFLFERDNYRYVSFGAVPLGSIHDVVPSR